MARKHRKAFGKDADVEQKTSTINVTQEKYTGDELGTRLTGVRYPLSRSGGRGGSRDLVRTFHGTTPARC